MCGLRGNSSVGRARPCQGRGREFESRFPLQICRRPRSSGSRFLGFRRGGLASRRSRVTMAWWQSGRRLHGDALNRMDMRPRVRQDAEWQQAMDGSKRGSFHSLAWWQSGHAAACKAVYAGSIPTQASIIQRQIGHPWPTAARVVRRRSGRRFASAATDVAAAREGHPDLHSLRPAPALVHGLRAAIHGRPPHASSGAGPDDASPPRRPTSPLRGKVILTFIRFAPLPRWCMDCARPSMADRRTRRPAQVRTTLRLRGDRRRRCATRSS